MKLTAIKSAVSKTNYRDTVLLNIHTKILWSFKDLDEPEWNEERVDSVDVLELNIVPKNDKLQVTWCLKGMDMENI